MLFVNRCLRETPSIAAWPCRRPGPLSNRCLPLPQSILVIAMGSADGEKQKPWSFQGVTQQSFSKIYFWIVLWNSLVGLLIFEEGCRWFSSFPSSFPVCVQQELNSNISTLHLLQWFLVFIMYIFAFSEVSPVHQTLEECMMTLEEFVMLDSKQKDHWSPFLLAVWERVNWTGQTRFLKRNCHCNCNYTSSKQDMPLDTYWRLTEGYFLVLTYRSQPPAQIGICLWASAGL